MAMGKKRDSGRSAWLNKKPGARTSVRHPLDCGGHRRFGHGPRSIPAQKRRCPPQSIGSLAFGEGFEEGDERGLIFRGEVEARFRMFRKVGIERLTALHAAAVMLDDFLQRGEPSVVHVGRGARHVAQAGHDELATVRRLARHL